MRARIILGSTSDIRVLMKPTCTSVGRSGSNSSSWMTVWTPSLWSLITRKLHGTLNTSHRRRVVETLGLARRNLRSLCAACFDSALDRRERTIGLLWLDRVMDPRTGRRKTLVFLVYGGAPLGSSAYKTTCGMVVLVHSGAPVASPVDWTTLRLPMAVWSSFGFTPSLFDAT